MEGIPGCKVVGVFGNGGHVLLVELNQLAVGFNTRGCDRLGENGGTTGNYIVWSENSIEFKR